MALPRAPAAWVLQSLNPLLGVEPGQGSGEVLPCSRLQQLLPFLLTLGIVCSHHCLGFLPGWRMLSHPVNPLLSGHGGMGGWKGRSRGGHNPPPSQGIHSWAVALGVKSDSCMPVLRHLRVHPHSWQMCWVLPAPPFPGCCQVELGWCPALTIKEGLVQGDGALLGLYQCFISELCSGASPWLLWNPVPRQCVSDTGCQHPRTQVVPAVGKGDFMTRCKSAVQGVHPMQVWEGKFLQCLCSVMLWVPTE